MNVHRILPSQRSAINFPKNPPFFITFDSATNHKSARNVHGHWPYRIKICIDSVKSANVSLLVGTQFWKNAPSQLPSAIVVRQTRPLSLRYCQYFQFTCLKLWRSILWPVSAPPINPANPHCFPHLSPLFYFTHFRGRWGLLGKSHKMFREIVPNAPKLPANPRSNMRC